MTADPRLDAFRILIVDDDADTCDTMTLLIKRWGFETITVRSGPEAVQASQVHTPDVVLLDIALPGPGGLQVAKRLREQAPPKGKRPFLIALCRDAETRQCSEDAGIDLHFSKPADPVILEKLLRRFHRIVMPCAETSTQE
jgi:CheY-like chemotaxis protein